MLAPYAGAIAGDHGLERRYGDGNVTRCPAPPKLAEARSALAESWTSKRNWVTPFKKARPCS